MISFQNPWVKPMIYAMSLCSITGALFWPEIIQTSIAAGQEPFSGYRFGDLASQTITGYSLKEAHNNAQELSATETISMTPGDGGGTLVTLQLDNAGRTGANDWPYLRLIYRDRDAHRVREEVLTPNLYTHTASLARSQKISFNMSPKPGETSAIFEPFYPASPIAGTP